MRVSSVGCGRLALWRGLIVMLASLFGVLAWAGPAAAHGDEAASAAIDDVRQAIAVIVNKPTDMSTIEDKIGDALESEDKEGVKVALVKQAKDALVSNDMMKVRDLLQRAIGARPDLSGTDVRPILQVPLVAGEETGTTVVTDPLPGRPDLTGTDITLLVLAGVLAFAGLVLSRRWRPPDSMAALRRRAHPAKGGDER